jgi:hypothetical protein
MLTWHGAIMSEANSPESVADFVRTPIGEIDTFVNAIAGHANETRIAGYVDLGVHWTSGACGDQDGLEHPSLQRRIVKDRAAPLAPSVVCFDRSFHQKHPNVDNARINESLETKVLGPVSLPFRNSERSPSLQLPPQQ